MKKLLILAFLLCLFAVPTWAQQVMFTNSNLLSYSSQTCKIDAAGDSGEFLDCTQDLSSFAETTTNVYTSDFSAGVDGWASSQGTATGNIDAIGGEDDVLRFTVNGVNSEHIIYKNSSFITNALYNIRFKFYIPSGQSNIDGVLAFFSGVTTIYDGRSSITDSWVNVDVYKVATHPNFQIYPCDGATTIFQDLGADDVFYIKDVVIEQVTSRPRISITDGTYWLVGFAGAVGAGETLGSELVTDGTFDTDIGAGTWTSNSASWTIGVTGLANYDDLNDAVYIAQSLTYPVNFSVVKHTFDIGLGTARIAITDQTGGAGIISGTSLTVGAQSIFKTRNGVGTYSGIRLYAYTLASAFTLDNFSIKRLTDPDSTGLRIYTSATGATRGWLRKDTGFNYNSATLRVYIDSENHPTYAGLAWNESTDTYTRRGTLSGQANGSSPGDEYLPIHDRMRRCVLSDAGVVQYYLCATDSTLKEDCSTAANLDGTDGQVMVEIPKFYYRYAYSNNTHYWDISSAAGPGFALHPAFTKDGSTVDYRYIGAYEGVLYDTSATRYANGIYISDANGTFATADDSITLTAPTNAFTNIEVGDKLTISSTISNNTTVTVASVISDLAITVSENLTDETDGAFIIESQKDFTATTGDVLASVSAKSPAVYGTRANFRVAASNRGTGWRQQDYNLTAALQLLYLIEYASFYSQSVIGAGITNVTDWDAYNDYNPIAPTGNSNSVGNATGNTAGSASSATESTKYMSYRGIENFYGHIWKWVDGINVNNNIPYVCTTETQYADDTTTNYTQITDKNGSGITLHNANGYQTTLEQTLYGFLPSAVGGSSSTYITDYYWQSTGWRVAYLGGSSSYGSFAGFFFWRLIDSSGLRVRDIGSRLCF